mmetsp:Transcript_43798/g.141269  ORF Transcript_43798/g.141269 Transcript_43798/m.141269 type:complete len:309 (+) Transcript_43798:342-1268(+)
MRSSARARASLAHCGRRTRFSPPTPSCCRRPGVRASARPSRRGRHLPERRSAKSARRAVRRRRATRRRRTRRRCRSRRRRMARKPSARRHPWTHPIPRLSSGRRARRLRRLRARMLRAPAADAGQAVPAWTAYSLRSCRSSCRRCSSRAPSRARCCCPPRQRRTPQCATTSLALRAARAPRASWPRLRRPRSLPMRTKRSSRTPRPSARRTVSRPPCPVPTSSRRRRGAARVWRRTRAPCSRPSVWPSCASGWMRSDCRALARRRSWSNGCSRRCRATQRCRRPPPCRRRRWRPHRRVASTSVRCSRG